MSIKMSVLKNRITVTTALMFGLVIGIIITRQFSNYAENCQIRYVSQDELMSLEQERVKNESIENKQVFFGQVEQAVKLASTVPKSFEDRATLVIYSTGVVTGKNVKSISKEVHAQIIAELTKKVED